MKKIGLVAVVALLLGAYPGATWFLGRQVESAVNEHYALLEDLPTIKVLERDYQRGWASSQETVTFELYGDLLRSLEQMQKEAAARNPEAAGMPAGLPMEPIRLTVRSEIKHGPFPGMSAFAAAVAESRLSFDGAFAQGLPAAVGGLQPVLARTVYRFDGGGHSTATIPGGFATFPAEKAGLGGNAAWEDVTTSIDFTRGAKHYTFQAEAPKLEIRSGNGESFVMSGLRCQADQTRIFADEPLLYAGTQKFSVEEISVAGEADGMPVVLGQLAMDSEMPVNGDFIDVGMKLGAEVAQFGAQDYGPARYEVSLRHLHARTVATLFRSMMELYANPAVMADQDQLAAAFAPLSEPFADLLRHDPEISLDRISFNTPHGEALVSARASLKGAQPGDFANAPMLVPKVTASADIAVPEGLVAKVAEIKAAAGDEAAMQAEALRQQILAFTQMGYIIQEGTLLKSRIEFRQGQLAVNGKRLN